jgi:hypothetical protein
MQIIYDSWYESKLVEAFGKILDFFARWDRILVLIEEANFLFFQRDPISPVGGNPLVHLFNRIGQTGLLDQRVPFFQFFENFFPGPLGLWALWSDLLFYGIGLHPSPHIGSDNTKKTFKDPEKKHKIDP